MALQTPVLFCVFNRPDVTRQVFEAIRSQRPRQLFVTQDGPRTESTDDRRLVAETRAILETVDWPCSVQTNFSETNLGCKRRMASGISWAFEKSERLIILEDDCLPDDSFFGFCETLLDRYANDDRVMMISGDNFQNARRSNDSYYFSKWSHIWGWASWRRAWDRFDLDMNGWPDARSNELLVETCCDSNEVRHWTDLFERQHAGSIDTWDFSWQFNCWEHRGLCILPEANLVTNLGFGPAATHTTDPNSRWANLPRRAIGLLRHPSDVVRNVEADTYTWNHVFKPMAPAPPDRPTRKKFGNWWRMLGGLRVLNGTRKEASHS